MSFRLSDLDYGMSDIDDPYNKTDLMNYAGTRAVELGQDPDLVLAMMGAESNFKPYAVSPAGARGPMQLMPRTAKDLGVNINDPYSNIDGGNKYIAQLSDRFKGNKALIAAGYNAGPGAVEQYGGIPPYPETQNYVSKVLGKPLPPSPSFGGSGFDSSLPSPSRRLADLSAAEEEIAGLQGIKTEALGQLGKGSNLSSQEALVTALTALVPTLIGWGVGGMQGGAMGAQAGAAGAGVGLSGFAAEAKERENANKLAYSDAATQLATKRGELKGIKDSIADREERNTELKYLYGENGAPGARSAASRPNASYTEDIQSALTKASRGEVLTPEEEASIFANPKAVDDLDNIRSRQGIDGRSSANRDLKGRIPDLDRRKVSADELSIQNYSELGNLVTGKDINTERIAEVLGKVESELGRRGNEQFTADGYDGLFNRVLATSGLDPNSYDYQVLERMKQIGRANAIAQPGVATNEDALQEIGFVSIKPGQSVDNYLANLARLSEGRARGMDVLLNGLEKNGYPYAKTLKDDYVKRGIIKYRSDASAGDKPKSKIKSIVIK